MVSALTHLKFEINSLLGQTFMRKKPQASSYKLLNLGCGSIVYKEWVNADFYPNLFRKKFWKYFTTPKIEWFLDLRYKLFCDDNFFEGVFTEHTFEHLTFEQVNNLLSELFRIMKTGAILRIIVPSLEKYISFYNGVKSDIKFNKFETPCAAISSLTQNFGHQSCWDFRQLKHYLEKNGFEHVKQLAFMEGADERLLKDQENRRWESLYVEARKLN